MSDLESRPCLRAAYPAGRIPNELGLRVFRRCLMQVGDLTEPERESIQTTSCIGRQAQSVEALGRGLEPLSGLTRGRPPWG